MKVVFGTVTLKSGVPLENINSETSLNTSCIVSLFNPLDMLLNNMVSWPIAMHSQR